MTSWVQSASCLLQSDRVLRLRGRFFLPQTGNRQNSIFLLHLVFDRTQLQAERRQKVGWAYWIDSQSFYIGTWLWKQRSLSAGRGSTRTWSLTTQRRVMRDSQIDLKHRWHHRCSLLHFLLESMFHRFNASQRIPSLWFPHWNKLVTISGERRGRAWTRCILSCDWEASSGRLCESIRRVCQVNSQTFLFLNSNI